MDHSDTSPETAALWPPPEPSTLAIAVYPPPVAQRRSWRAEIAAELGPPPDVQVLKTLAWLVSHDEVWEDRQLSAHTAAYLDATSVDWRQWAADPADSPEAEMRAIARHTGAKRLRSLRQWHDQRDVVDAAAGILRRPPVAPPGESGTDAS
jgi:hypothetical protein